MKTKTRDTDKKCVKCGHFVAKHSLNGCVHFEGCSCSLSYKEAKQQKKKELIIDAE